MPKASNGEYSLPTGSIVSSGETILVSQHNPPLLDIATALTDSLDRDGRGAMRADLDMGGYKLTNLGEGTSETDIATLGQVRAGTITPVSGSEIDCSQGNYFTRTVDTATVVNFTFANVPDGAYGLTLRVNHVAGSIAFPASVYWPRAGSMPTLTAGRNHLFMFVTEDAGTTWRAAALVDYTA